MALLWWTLAGILATVELAAAAVGGALMLKRECVAISDGDAAMPITYRPAVDSRAKSPVCVELI